ncbi:MAG: hypothetical protein ACYTG2_19625, partial [Planctomycetota bacterium]
MSSRHEPSSKQHAPSGCGQLAARHETPPNHETPPASVQRCSVTYVHEPSSKQHAPSGCGHSIWAHV